MIPHNLNMHRESRILLQDLERLAKLDNITTMVTLGDVYQCDQLVLKYYTSVISSLIHSKIEHISKKSSKHFGIQYWATIMESTFSTKDYTHKGFIYTIDKGNPPAVFAEINKYMQIDYSDKTAATIYEIMRKYDESMIMHAINVGKQNKVYSIQYVKAVIEKEQALSNMRKQDMERLASKAESATSILNKEKVNNTISDVASAAYNWDKSKEDAELVAQFNAMFGGSDNG